MKLRLPTGGCPIIEMLSLRARTSRNSRLHNALEYAKVTTRTNHAIDSRGTLNKVPIGFKTGKANLQG